jgi:hypothetical protein
LIKRILSTVALWSIIAVTLWFFRTSGPLVPLHPSFQGQTERT